MKVFYKTKDFVFYLWLLIAVVGASYAQAQQVIRFNQQTHFNQDSDQAYFEALLKLVLEETLEDFGPYKLSPVKIDMVQARGLSMLKANQGIDVIWTMTSAKREQELQAIYIPLLKGLMGYRVFLIRKGDQHRFGQVKDLEGLSSFVAGQGVNWPDAMILKHNQLPVQEGLGSLLHEMLAKHRFDYFPRAITEITKESAHYPQFEIEKSLMFQYLAPMYFFVSKDNGLLAKRLTTGLTRLIANGEFEQFLLTSRHIQQLFEQLNLNGRRVFQLENPLLSARTKALQKNKTLWLKVQAKN